jgi:hypothetical protein
MIKVIGNNHERISLLDIGDVVYYKQIKVYSDEEYARSRDLQKKIKNGDLIIIEQADKQNISHTSFVDSPIKPQTNDSSNVSLLLLHIKNLEDKLEEIKSKEPIVLDSKVDSSKIEELNAKIKDLEEKIQNKEKIPNEDILIKAIQSLEQKISTNNQASELINKLEGLIGKASLGIVSQEVKEESVFRPEEIYVPNIQVEDGNSHIKLKVRTIEQSSDINDAAAALKNLKSKPK